MALADRIPQRIKDRAAPLVERFDTVLREFEWTWTKAVIASLLLWFMAIGALAILPSWWLYFAEQKLGWRQRSFWLFKLRDIVASGFFGTPFLLFIVVPYFVQKRRRRLRSESESRPVGGYR